MSAMDTLPLTYDSVS